MREVRDIVDKMNKERENKEKLKRTDETKISVEAAVKGVIERYEWKGTQNSQTTQLVKLRFPSIWSGQDFDHWKIEIDKWSKNNRSSEEDKYFDLIKSL